MTWSLTGGSDAVAVVTGGGWNIGRATAQRLARAGARVVVASRQEARLKETLAGIEAAGGQGLAIPTDVTRLEDVEAVIAQTLDLYGRIDILVAAAGGAGAHAPIDAVDPSEWCDVFAKNVFGAFYAARCALPIMREQNRGVILTFTGGGAFFPWVGVNGSAYATAKAAICRFTDQLQAELLDTAIRVHCVAPGLVWDPDRLREVEAEEARTGTEHPERHINRPPEDAAELVEFLASEESAFLRGRVVAVSDDWWRDPARVRAVEDTVHLYRLRRVEEP